MELFEITMYGSVAAEDESRVGVLTKFARPVSSDTFAEGSETTLRHARFEDGGDVQTLKITLGKRPCQ